MTRWRWALFDVTFFFSIQFSSEWKCSMNKFSGKREGEREYEYNENDDRYQLLLTLNTQSARHWKKIYKNGHHIFLEYFRVWLLCKFFDLNGTNIIIIILFFLTNNNNNDNVTLVAPSHNAILCVFEERKNISAEQHKKAPSLQKSFKELTFYYYSLVFWLLSIFVLFFCFFFMNLFLLFIHSH